MASNTNDSHLSQGNKTGDADPLKQKHRNALGEKVDGQTNPYGADSGDKSNKIANNQGKRY